MGIGTGFDHEVHGSECGQYGTIGRDHHNLAMSTLLRE
jgi:hypothetical protein